MAVDANEDDGWNIGSIVTLIQDTDNGIQLLTQDFDVDHWVDSEEGQQLHCQEMISFQVVHYGTYTCAIGGGGTY